MQGGKAGKREFQVVIQLGHGAHGGARGPHWIALVDGDGGRDSLHAVHGRFIHAVQELTRIGGKGLDIAPLSLGIQGIERQGGLARAADTRHHDQRPRGQGEIQIFQVVLPCPPNADFIVTESVLAGPPGARGGRVGCLHGRGIL